MWICNVSTGNHTKFLILLKLKCTMFYLHSKSIQFNKDLKVSSCCSLALHLSVKGYSHCSVLLPCSAVASKLTSEYLRNK